MLNRYNTTTKQQTKENIIVTQTIKRYETVQNEKEAVK